MRIGIEAQRIFRKKKHGMDMVAIELIRHLQFIDKKNEYFIFVKPDEDDRIIPETRNFRIIKVEGGPYPFWEQVRLPSAAAAHGVHLLHCTSNTAPLRWEKPLVVTLHDIIYLERLNLTQGTAYQIAGNLYRRWNVPHVVNKASHIITVSDFERNTINKRFNLGNRLSTIHNAVSSYFKKITDDVVWAEARRKYKLPDNFIFYLGNTDPKKNLRGLLKALSILRERNQLTIPLVMLDIDREFLSGCAKQIGDDEILKYIHFTGYVPNQELPVIYSLATLFIYPSLRESFGIPILEAMSCGVPVITSNTSSMPEIAGDAAFYIDPHNPSTLADGIIKVLGDHELRATLSEKGQQRVKSFSWQQNAEETLSIYQSILENQRKH